MGEDGGVPPLGWGVGEIGPAGKLQCGMQEA